MIKGSINNKLKNSWRQPCIHLYGSTTASGQAFLDQISEKELNWNIIKFSRNKNYKYNLNLDNPENFNDQKAPNPNLIISFAPIWKISKFLEYQKKNNQAFFESLKGIICCSSSSSVTRRFAFNQFDKDLVLSLIKAEKKIISFSKNFNLNFVILRPTLIYGDVKNYKDKNLNLIVNYMRKLPFIFFPSNTGLRQPIHAKELSLLAINYSNLIFKINNGEDIIELCLEVGGDEIMTYLDMIKRIKDNLPLYDQARKCRIIPIPNRLFYFFSSFIILFSPKKFESILRISADLSNFNGCNSLLGLKKRKFPYEQFR